MRKTPEEFRECKAKRREIIGVLIEDYLTLMTAEAIEELVGLIRTEFGIRPLTELVAEANRPVLKLVARRRGPAGVSRNAARSRENAPGVGKTQLCPV